MLSEPLTPQEKLYFTLAMSNARKLNLIRAALPPRSDVELERDMFAEITWRNSEVWKSVTGSLLRGVRDQSPDFNKWKTEVLCFVVHICDFASTGVFSAQVLPASWAIAVDGRAPVVDEPPPDENEDDATCQVCFDGESLDANPIVFCDHCNIAVHKVCTRALLCRCAYHVVPRYCMTAHRDATGSPSFLKGSIFVTVATI